MPVSQISIASALRGLVLLSSHLAQVGVLGQVGFLDCVVVKEPVAPDKNIRLN
jgi:hypothetical protein